MSKFSKIICLVFILIGAFVFFNTHEAVAQTTATNPQFQIQLGDANDSTPNHPGDCAVNTSQWGTSVSGSGDQDCIKIRFTPGTTADQYTKDFQVCLTIESSTGCSRWASDGGGWSSQIKSNSGQFDSANIFVNTRNAPAGEYYTNVDGLITLYYKSSGSSNCGAGGNVIAKTSNGVWGYSTYNDDDPGCAQIGLEVQKNSSYNAQFVRSTVTGGAQTAANTFTVAPSATYPASLYMKNTGNPWYSSTPGTLVSSSRNPQYPDCSGWEPTQAGQTCTETRSFTSSDIVLSRIDQTSPAQITAPAELNYKKLITYTYLAVEYEIEPEDPPPPDPETCPGGVCIITSSGETPKLSLWGKLVNFFFPKVSAQSGTGLVVVVSASGSEDIYTDPETNFPFNFTTTSFQGQSVLQYKMKKKSGPASGTDAQGFFGGIATLTINTSGNPTSGTISATGCGIAVGASSCNATVTYSVQNPIPGANTAVTYNKPPANTTCPGTTATSGTNVPCEVYAGQTTFYLYHNGVELGQVTITAVGGTFGTLTGPSFCIIPFGSSSCNDVNLSWSIDNIVAVPTEITYSQNGNTVRLNVSNSLTPTSQSGVKEVPVTLGSRMFYLYSFHNGSDEPPLAQTSVDGQCLGRWDPGVPKCVRDGGWSACSVSCGGGTRNCNNPTPAGGGLECLKSDGSRGLSDTCNTQACAAGIAVCGATHYTCSVGTNPQGPNTGGTNKNLVSKWEWKCNGLNPDPAITSDDVSCTELKKKPIFIEN